MPTTHSTLPTTHSTLTALATISSLHILSLSPIPSSHTPSHTPGIVEDRWEKILVGKDEEETLLVSKKRLMVVSV
jgi:hypothetical protein